MRPMRLARDHAREMLPYFKSTMKSLVNTFNRASTTQDLLDFHYAQWHWPSFNLADVWIVLGAALFIWAEIRHQPGTYRNHTLECTNKHVVSRWQFVAISYSNSMFFFFSIVACVSGRVGFLVPQPNIPWTQISSYCFHSESFTPRLPVVQY